MHGRRFLHTHPRPALRMVLSIVNPAVGTKHVRCALFRLQNVDSVDELVVLSQDNAPELTERL